MKKRIISLLLAACMVASFAGCKGNKDTSSATSIPKDAVSDIKAESKYAVNPLTGTEDLAKDAATIKPVAIMINNIETAWGVQASLSKADIIYETFVEGGITRCMAVFKDIRTVGKNKIGSLRSGRYSYVDLALGNGAQYVHAGLDEKYCGPHIREVGTKTVDLNTTADNGSIIGGNSCAFRYQNGLAIEHTLYTTGKDLYKFLKKNVDMTLKTPQDNWMNFVEKGKEYTPAGGVCKKLFVPFSGSTYSAEFKYNDKTMTYDKYRYGETQKDYNDGKTVSVANVLVLYSEVTAFGDNKHMKTDLTSGSGYYVSRGGYVKIKWSKGNANDPIKLTDENGNALNYNQGKTYVCYTSNGNKGSTKFK